MVSTVRKIYRCLCTHGSSLSEEICCGLKLLNTVRTKTIIDELKKNMEYNFICKNINVHITTEKQIANTT